MALSIEKAAELGFYLVHKAEGLVRFERVHAAGTAKFEGATEDEALEAIDAHLATHPGAFGTDVSRSDGAVESLDVQVQHSAQVGPSDLPTPAADAAAAAAAPAAEANTAAVGAVEVTASTAVGDVQASPAAEVAPEVES